MICFPNAKLNLGLAVTSRRSDGYHTLETVFVPLPLHDVLEVEPTEREYDTLYITSHGYVAEPTNNLVMRAIEAMRTIRELPPLTVALEKHIPAMAGLGGGSADAAFMLRLLNDRFHLKVEPEEMERLALSLGADCPFFLHNQPAIARGVGERLEPLPTDLMQGLFAVVVRPTIDISTPKAYAALGMSVGETCPGMSANLLDFLRRGNIKEAARLLSNVFEERAILEHPRIGILKEELKQEGAFFSLMSGSGSAVYGLFESETQAKRASARASFADCFVWQGAF
ncbi:MAG: 4-(cytidine 5'-diphospho)-2-C-methyl-D-erythritol kinase [Porphyromonas sp.]|nr:4-(cytidine 5'-diphospho)-2-C-methyl-D-erythritol kinase [Porphyromonas sp.]